MSKVYTNISSIINGMSYIDRCKLLNGSPVIIARHFQYQMKLFFSGSCSSWPYYERQIIMQLEWSFKCIAIGMFVFLYVF